MSKLLINLSVVFSQPTGISKYATNLVPYLKTLYPTLLTAESYPEFNCYSVPNNLTPAQGTKGHLTRLFWTEFKLPKIYHQLKSQLLFSPLPEAPLFSDCRYIVTIHDVIPLRFPKRFSPLTPYHRYYIPQISAKAQHIICNSQATAQDIIKFYNIPASKITAIPLAYDRTHFRPVLDKWQGNPYFLYIGRHDPHKNLHRLINAFAKLPNNEYELWLAGPVDKRYTPLLKQQAEELGLLKQVKFLNYVPYAELPQIISNAIALVFPSLWEGFGFPVLEAMGVGTPVITSNLSSLPEVAGDAAILINPYDIQEMTEAMRILATDNLERSRLSNKAIEQASKFSWEKTAQTTIEVLSSYM
jgi:glycosyltransferase involved in cell wall biosynthesis